MKKIEKGKLSGVIADLVDNQNEIIERLEKLEGEHGK